MQWENERLALELQYEKDQREALAKQAEDDAAARESGKESWEKERDAWKKEKVWGGLCSVVCTGMEGNGPRLQYVLYMHVSCVWCVYVYV